MRVAFGHVLPDSFTVLQLQCRDAASLSFHTEFQPDKEIPEFGRERRRRAYPIRFRERQTSVPVTAFRQ